VKELAMSERGDGPLMSTTIEVKPGEIPLGTSLLVAPLILAASVLIGAVVSHGFLRVAPSTLQGEVTLFNLIEALTSQIVIVALVVFYLWRVRSKVLDWLALDRPIRSFILYLQCFVAVLGCIGIYNGALYMAFKHDPLTDLWPYAPLIGGPWWWLALIVIGMGAPVSEEILFRGYLLTAFRRSSLGFLPSALITTSLWTLLHFTYSAAGLIEVFMVGMLFSTMVRATGSLRPALFCHAVYNSALVLGLRWFV
jgi:uncharacterized protein